MVSDQQQPQGVHLVGSIPLSSTEEVFRHVCKALPNHLHRIPDGETGERGLFVVWQFKLFPEETWAWGVPAGQHRPDEEVTAEDVARVVASLPPIQTGYDDAAVASYAIFRKLKDEGVIPKHIRFQVSLPTTTGLLVCLRRPYRTALEPLYLDALGRALAVIQTTIPAHDLAIQWDVATDYGILEGVPFLQPWFSPVHSGVVDRILWLADKVADDVPMGFHHCYGDYDHKHYVEPRDTATMVGVANALFARLRRPVAWIHMPVPKGRDDVEYFAPLRDLVPNLAPETEFYLGLVHADDEAGTRRRIKAAEQAGVRRFGLATECGIGRTPARELDSIFAISTSLSKPYT